MRAIPIFLAAIISMSAATGCKTKKSAGSTAGTTSSSGSSTSSSGTVTMTTSSSSTPGVGGASGNETTNTTVTEGKGAYTGKVSHKYRKDGCNTVIIFTGEDGKEVTLIPKDALNKDIDVDGQTISFDYHPLKMPQPEGCSTGIPAEISNIVKLK